MFIRDARFNASPFPCAVSLSAAPGGTWSGKIPGKERQIRHITLQLTSPVEYIVQGGSRNDLSQWNT